MRWIRARLALAGVFALALPAAAQGQVGTVRGVVYDQDFRVPLAAAQVKLVETGLTATSTDQGTYALGDVPPGRYTVVFSKEGYESQIKPDVLVAAGRLTDLDAYLSGDFIELEEYVVQDISFGGGTELALLELRFESPSLVDSISAELMSRAGASDAASALRLVTGASIQDDKFAVIRGLPDRYVTSQINGVRLPSADEETRAVELDQFPAAVIESIQVSKTFTPDQQGDASGGAVNVILTGIPEEPILQFKAQYGYNSQAGGESDFLTYPGGGVSTWGNDDGDRVEQPLGTDWDGAVGVSTTDAPIDFKFSGAAGGKQDLDNGVRIGGFVSAFYERDSSYFDDGVSDQWWVENPGDPLTPQFSQGAPSQGDFRTSLFDVTQGKQAVQWGGLASLGLETEHHTLGAAYLYSRTAEDRATLAEDTRGKEFYFGPDYDPTDPTGIGNDKDSKFAAPYLRTQTLEYTERTADTLQLSGRHQLATDEFGVDDAITFRAPEVDWTVSRSSASLNQPDKRQFGSAWLPDSFEPGIPPFLPEQTVDAFYLPFKPDANFTLGNLQRIFKTIEEESQQYTVNVKLPFEQWAGDEGYFRVGLFDDRVRRSFDQNSYSNFSETGLMFAGQFDEFWSDAWPSETHIITDGPPFVDVDYEGEQRINAWYAMVDVPVASNVNVITGARFESTDISIVNTAEMDATYFDEGSNTVTALAPGVADVDFEQDDVLPAVAVEYRPQEQWTLRAGYSQTIARQTFRELTPILQQEFLGAPIFIGNPRLDMSELKNYDLRVDYEPYEGGLFSMSWFKKDIEDPIENVQKVLTFNFTTPVNFPKGELTGWEFEVRQDLARFNERLDGFSVGANATFIDSEVTLPASEVALFNTPGIQVPMTTRDATNAPEFLYNLYTTFDIEESGTQLGLFYTVRGDTLVAGAGVDGGNFVPNVYAEEFGTLNFSLNQRISERWRLQFQAKNLTNPDIKEVYRGPSGERTRTSFSKGQEYSISLSVSL